MISFFQRFCLDYYATLTLTLLNCIKHLSVHGALEGLHIRGRNHFNRSTDGRVHIEGLERIDYPIGAYDVYADVRGISSPAARPKPSSAEFTRLIAVDPIMGLRLNMPLVNVIEPLSLT